jgi:hypothetical protein
MRIITFSLFMTLLTGCSMFSSRSAAEPPTLVIRNSCARDLSAVTLKEPRIDGQRVSMGSISPVLRSAPFVYRRPHNPPPLLRRMKVVWTEEGGQAYQKEVDLTAVLKQATGAQDEALVFDLRPGGIVQVYLSRIQ